MGQLGDLARLEAGEVVPRARRIELRAAVAAIVARYGGMAAERGVSLVPPATGEALPLWIDPDLLDKILGNLLHNALKFTPRGGEVAVLLHVREAEVRFTVDDTGPGVPEAARARVFDRLFQVERQDDRSQEGSGIGLALAKELTELCGGAIGNEPRARGGTRFWFTLPRGSAHLLPEEVLLDDAPGFDDAPAAVGPDGAPLVLVVEDHPDMRAWIVEELREGFRVATAVDGVDGLARAAELRPALIVTDVMMPRMDGVAMARALRERGATPPILLVSAKVGVGEVDRSVADGFLPKPFSSAELRAEARRLTGVAGPVEVEVDRRLLGRLEAAVDARLADESLSVPELAQAVAMSERTLHRELARVAGVSPARWIREHRLRRAEEMLRQGRYRTVAEVAAAVGMSRAWFTRAYRAWRGQSPGADLPDA